MEKIIDELKQSEELINKIVLSDTKSDTKKIVIRPIKLKQGVKWQIERFVAAQVFHENVDFDKIFNLPFLDYKQITIEKAGETCIFAKGKTSYKKKTNKNEQTHTVKSHNKEKNYFINEGDDVPALVDLGVFTKDGKIVNSMFDKFKQINKFIEIIDDAFRETGLKEVTILDFGCGKSYLTF